MSGTAIRGRLLRRVGSAAALSLVLLAACNDDGAPAEPERGADPTTSAAATVVATGVRLVNSGRAPLAFAAFEREFSTRSLFAPCVDPGPLCVRLPAGQSVVIPFGQIGGYTAGAREAVVHTWRVVPDGAGAYRAADFRSQVLRL